MALFEPGPESEIEKALSNADKVSKHEVDQASVDEAKSAATSTA